MRTRSPTRAPLHPRSATRSRSPSREVVSMPSYPVIPHDALRQLRDLDNTLPQFHEQLSDFFHGSVYQNALPELQGGSLVWLVEYLDSVGLKITLLNSVTNIGLYWLRFSPVFPTPQDPHSRNPCMSLERYAASGGCYRNRARFQNHSWGLCTWGHLIVQRCASGV